MLKKRSIATMMAAATVATSVAPVFAATIVKETVKKGSDEQKALVNDLRKLLAEGTKFEVVGNKSTNKVGDSVYEIRTTSGTVESLADFEDESLVGNVLELEKRIEALKDDESLYVYVVDKGHGMVNGKVSDVNANGDDITDEILAEIKVDNTVSVVGEYKVADFYDGEYLTASGLELISIMEGKIDSKFNSITVTVDDIETISNKEYSINVKFDVDYVDASKENEIFNIKISGNDLKYVRDLHEYLKDTETAGATKIAGDDRFETAVAIAKETYGRGEGKRTTSGVVLVNATSMIDGLTAAPLAAQLDNPVLLTDTDSLPTSTLSYIKSQGITKVTIVGGEAVVSNGVKRQLEAMGVTVERIGGKDRHATSLEVAIKLESLGVNLGDKNADAGKVFVVAATGEADAMSIAPIASKKGEVAPIIVEGFDGMSTTAKELLKNTKKVDLIGGKVSEETQKAYDKKGDFIYGEDRFETNAKIVRNYFEEGADAIYVAKDGYTENNNEMLVDALAVGSLAGEENAAIILASKELTVKQKEAVQLVSTKYDTTNIDDATKITQIGGGLAHNVVKQVAKLLGFNKN